MKCFLLLLSSSSKNNNNKTTALGQFILDDNPHWWFFLFFSLNLTFPLSDSRTWSSSIQLSTLLANNNIPLYHSFAQSFFLAYNRATSSKILAKDQSESISRNFFKIQMCLCVSEMIKSTKNYHQIKLFIKIDGVSGDWLDKTISCDDHHQYSGEYNKTLNCRIFLLEEWFILCWLLCWVATVNRSIGGFCSVVVEYDLQLNSLSLSTHSCNEKKIMIVIEIGIGV